MDADLIQSLAEAIRLPGSRLSLRLRGEIAFHRQKHKLLRSMEKRRWFAGRREPSLSGAASVLGRDPPVVLVPIGGPDPLLPVRAIASGLNDRPLTFVLLVYWSLESELQAARIGSAVRRHRLDFPRHRLVFLCNTEAECGIVRQRGGTAAFINQNMLVDEHVFRPLPGIAPTADAVYNARLSLYKRHYLGLAIERLTYITYLDGGSMPEAASRAYLARLQAVPGHRIANPMTGGLPARLAPADVNRIYAEAAVGLCLSPVEGAMYASMEYLLAGLPVVTTPSRGGRDVFLHADHTVTVPPDASAVRRAVETLRDRGLDRDEIRARTLALIEPHRQRFLELLAEIAVAQGGAPPSDWSAIRSRLPLRWGPLSAVGAELGVE